MPQRVLHDWLRIGTTRLPGARGWRLREWFRCQRCGCFTDTHGRYGRVRVAPCLTILGEARQLSLFDILDPNADAFARWLRLHQKENESCA